MAGLKDKKPNAIHREHRHFIGFLKDLHMNQGYNEVDLIDVCAKPWKWQAEFNTYLRRFALDMHDVAFGDPQCHVDQCVSEPNGVDGKCTEHSAADLEAIADIDIIARQKSQIAKGEYQTILGELSQGILAEQKEDA